MSELQIYLIGIGALIIIAVLIFNWWQERQFHRQVERSFFPLERDALLDEPSLDVSALDADQMPSAHSSNQSDDRAADHFFADDELPEITQHEPTLQNFSTETINANERANQATQDRAFVSEELAAVIQAEDNELSKQHIDFKEIYNESLLKMPRTEPQIQPQMTASDTDEEIKEDLIVQEDAFQAANTMPLMLDSNVDLTAVIYLAVETSASMLSAAFNALIDGFDKPIYVHVLDTSNQWHLLHVFVASPELMHRKISRTTCSIQLADRGGALSRNTLNRFQLVVETIGLDINGLVEWQGINEALTNASALDAFCIEVDKTIGFHLMHGENGPFTGTKLRGLAESQGLILGSDGGFKFFDDTNSNKLQFKPAFVIFNREDYPFSQEMLRNTVVKAVTFQMDIPHVKQCVEAFNHMVQIAKQMEVGLNARLVDDNNRLLGDMQIDKIRQQLKAIQTAMLMRGIVPGSESAHRLFS